MLRLPIALMVLSCLASAQTAEIQAGPAVGKKIPAFQASDQTGRVRTLADLAGESGLVLLFVRSADW